MYLRFVSSRAHPRVPAEAGIFEAYWRLKATLDPRLDKQSRRLAEPMLRHRVLRRKWLALLDAAEPFRRLGMPVLRGPARDRRARQALFWFKPDARWRGRAPGTVVLDARAFAGQLARWQVEIREIRTAEPGEIIWDDRYQILAIPKCAVPRAFSA